MFLPAQNRLPPQRAKSVFRKYSLKLKLQRGQNFQIVKDRRRRPAPRPVGPTLAEKSYRIFRQVEGPT
jgi:hypothetical protein